MGGKVEVALVLPRPPERLHRLLQARPSKRLGSEVSPSEVLAFAEGRADKDELALTHPTRRVLATARVAAAEAVCGTAAAATPTAQG